MQTTGGGSSQTDCFQRSATSALNCVPVLPRRRLQRGPLPVAVTPPRRESSQRRRIPGHGSGRPAFLTTFVLPGMHRRRFISMWAKVVQSISAAVATPNGRRGRRRRRRATPPPATSQAAQDLKLQCREGPGEPPPPPRPDFSGHRRHRRGPNFPKFKFKCRQAATIFAAAGKSDASPPGPPRPPAVATRDDLRGSAGVPVLITPCHCH